MVGAKKGRRERGRKMMGEAREGSSSGAAQRAESERECVRD